VAEVSAGMGREEMQAAWAAGEALSVDEAVAYAVRGAGGAGVSPTR
jgi:hypothetical protein